MGKMTRILSIAAASAAAAITTAPRIAHADTGPQTVTCGPVTGGGAGKVFQNRARAVW